MDRWVLAFAVAGLVAVGGFWLLLATGRKAAVPTGPDGRLTLRHGTLFRAYACGLFLGLELLIGSLALFLPPASLLAAGMMVTAALIAGALGLVLIWDAYRFGLTVTSAGLETISPWRGPRMIPWAEVNRVSFSTANLWFAVEPKQGPPFHVLAVVPGIRQFLAACEANLPVETLLPAEAGYDWVWRKFPPVKDRPPRGPSRFRVWALRIGGALILLLALGLGLIAFNGLVLASRESVVIRDVAVNATAKGGGGPNQVVVLTYNVAKAFAHRGGLSFEEPERVTKRLDQIATTIQITQPDLVCLSEVMTEAGPMPVDQVEYLAKAAKLKYVAFGENYNFGIPGFRVVGGNAILSRTPLTPVANFNLTGRKPFFVTSNNRRALFCETTVREQTVLVGSLHNDSFDPANNDAQVSQILAFVGDRPTILAGDFNATPETVAMRRIEESKRFSGEIDGKPSFPAHAPTKRIDYAFGPAEWTHNGTHVLLSAASDHRPVVALFTVPAK
jgi:endonuclease/exonuclease/phosphatase family metal-dependent hydrolase